MCWQTFNYNYEIQLLNPPTHQNYKHEKSEKVNFNVQQKGLSIKFQFTETKRKKVPISIGKKLIMLLLFLILAEKKVINDRQGFQVQMGQWVAARDRFAATLLVFEVWRAFSVPAPCPWQLWLNRLLAWVIYCCKGLFFPPVRFLQFDLLQLSLWARKSARVANNKFMFNFLWVEKKTTHYHLI